MDELKERIKELEELLAQAALIIDVRPKKVVYRSARQAWMEQYKALGLQAK